MPYQHARRLAQMEGRGLGADETLFGDADDYPSDEEVEEVNEESICVFHASEADSHNLDIK